MGEYADMMLDGTCCVTCGEYLGGDGDGFAVQCAGCSADDPNPLAVPESEGRDPAPALRKIERPFKCICCNRTFSTQQQAIQHVTAKHAEEFIIDLEAQPND